MMVPIDTSNTGATFAVIATVDTVDEQGTPVAAGSEVNRIIGLSDGSGGIIGWTPPPGYHVVQITTN